MPSYSKTSKARLDTCHQDLITLFHYVVQGFDCTIIYGYRSPELQFELYKKGRKEIDGLWLIRSKKKVVTYCDGTIKKSKHNESPSIAVDVCPYPINFKDVKTIRYFAGYVKGWAAALKKYNAIEHDVIWGGDWDNDNDLHDQTFYDLLHYQLKL
jgi:peptidoglycan LD-endopeptidase CwlK